MHSIKSNFDEVKFMIVDLFLFNRSYKIILVNLCLPCSPLISTISVMRFKCYILVVDNETYILFLTGLICKLAHCKFV